MLTVNAKSEETVAWVKATSLEAGKEYLIVGKSGNSYYALANNDSKKVSVTISGDTVVLTEANEEIAKWTTAVTSGNQTIGGGFTLSNNNTFLGRNNTWDVVFYSATSAAGERKVGFDYENGYLFNTSNGSGSSTTQFYLQYSNDKFAFVYQNQEQNITLYVKSTVSGGETPEQPGQPDQPGSGDDDTVDGSFPVASTLTTGRYVIAINNYAMTATHGSTEVENNYWGSTTTTTYPGLEAAQVEMEGTNIVGGVTKSMVWDVKVDGSNITIMNESTETYLDATYSTNGNTRELELVSTGYDTWLYSDSALYTTKTSTAAYIALLNDELFSVRGSSNKGVVKFYSVGNATVDPDEPGQGGEQPEEPEIPDTPVVPGTGSNIGFTSDVHDKTTDLETWLTNVQSKVDPDLERMAFGGDFTYNRSITSFNNAVSIVNKLVGQDKGVYTTGNHEYDNSSVATQMANTKGFVRAGLAVDATNYKIYNIGAYTGDGTGSFQVSDINALDAYLDTAPTNVPIFVVSHYPLHYHSWRTIGNAQMMIEKLNEHPNVVFVWGHNHSQSDPNYGKIQTAAKNNSIEYASGTTAKINFTYLSAGAMYGNAGSYYGMVASVSASGDAVTFQYYDLKGNTVGDAVTVRYATHAHTIKSVAASEATCTEKGMAAHYYCDCGKYFSNAEGTTEVTKASLETPMAAHDWDTEKYTWEKNGNSWTCTAERTCKNSNHTTPETATATVTSKVATPATCVEMGTTTYTATFSVDWADQQTKDVEDIATIAHDYTDSYVDNENDANHTAKCECGDDITENHSYVSGKCVCGATKVEEEKEFTKVSAPTSGKEYVIVINGYGMGATKTDFTDQSNSYVALEGTAVTIADTNAGKKITSDVRDDMFWQVNITGTKYEIKNVKNGTYLNCEYDGSSNRKLTLVSTPNSDWSYSDNHLVNSDHNNGAYLSLFDTKFSVRSNYWMETYPERFVVEFYEVGAVCEHTNKEDLKAVEATCTTTGLTAGKKCSDCGAIIVAQTEVAMKDHDWGTVEYTWTKNGNSWTCTAEHTCANSNHTTPETATATVTSKVATPATCDKMGTTTYTATFSVDWATQQTKDVEDIATIAHDYTDSYVDNENDANHTAKCECGDDITENHSYVSGKCVCGATKVEEEKEFTKVPTPTSGQDYVIVIDDEAMRGIVAEDTNRSDNNANYIYSGLKAAKVTVVSEKITSDVTADMIWTVTKNGNNYTIQNKSTGKYLNAEYYEESGSPKITRYRKLTLVDSNYDTWTYSNNYLGSSDNSNNCYLSAVNSVFSVRSDANSETRRTVYFFEVGSGTVTPDPEPATLSSIAVAKQPTKTVYTEGENFDPAGMEITATYSNDTTKVVTDDVTYDDQKLTVNTKIVTVSYTEGGVTKTATVDITVKAKTPSGSSETIYVAFSSDVHNNGSASSSNTSAYRLNTWLNNVSAAIDSTFVNMAFCGDNGNAGTSGQSYWNNVQYVMDVVTNSDKVATNGIFANGNHEFQNGNQSSTQTNATAKAIKSSGYNEVYSNYAIYVLGAESGTQEFTKGALENLKSWLAQNAADGKPVFIISHYPIHFNQGQWNRTSGNAATLVEYLNPYPNVVFLWGHNHTERDPHYQEIYTAGTELQLTSSSSSKVTINFTYAAAGCMAGSEYNTASESISAKGLVAKITDGKLVSLTQYKADGTALDSQVFDGTDTPVVPDPTPDPEPVEGSYKKVNAPIADKKYAVVIEGYAMTNGTDGFTDSNNSNTAYETLKGTQVTITGEYITSDVTNSMLWQVVVNSNGQMALQNVETGEYLYGEYNDNGSRILKTVSGDAVYAWSYDSNNDYLTNSDKTSDGGATYLSTYNSNNDNNKFCLRSDYHITNNNGTNAKYYKVYFYEYAESTSTHKPTYVGKQDSTCTETGMEAHYYCADCGKYFSNAAGENEVTKDSLVIEAKGHSWKATEKDYKWSADFTKCTVTGVCENDATHTNPVTVNSTSSVKTPADCQTAKVTTYIVTFNLDWATTQKQDVTGEKDPNTHAKNTFEYTDKNNGKHEKAYECCGAIAATEDHDYSETTHNCVCGNIEKFTVTWVVDSKTVKTEEVAYGATIKVPANEPTKDADGCTEYEFVKWTGYTANMTMPAEDVTFTAEFDAVTEHNFENGECVDCGAADPNYKPAGLLGDADGNGYVNNRDAMIIAQYVVGGLAENQKIYLDLADVDGNGYVNNRDAMYIARYVIGDISVFPAQKQSV